MGRLTILAVSVVVLVILGSLLFFAQWDFPAPSVAVEKVLPDARFPK
jgi:hypothetical protein